MPDPLDSVALLLCVADPIRWAVLQHLSGGEACVCEIQTVVEVAPNLLSYHLRVLREAGLVSPVDAAGGWTTGWLRTSTSG